MKNEDLIKKLENVRLPEISSESHKAKLRLALLDSGCFKQPDFWGTFRRYAVFAAPALAVFIILGITVAVRPKLAEAQVLGIIKNNPEVQKIISEQELTLDEIKIKDGKAYVLLSHSEDSGEPVGTSTIKITKTQESDFATTGAAVVEINLKKKEVLRIKSIGRQDINPLGDEEKDSAKEIINDEDVVSDIIPESAEVEEIQSAVPKEIHLEEQDGEIKAVSGNKSDRRAEVQYKLNGEKWVVKVNLDEKRVEEINYSSKKGEINKGREQ
jgi:hypothetical protein